MTAYHGAEHVQHRFPPHVLREYSLLADGYRGAVCGPRGEIVWMCAPRWHDDAVFSALLGGAGVYAITPLEPAVWGGNYEDRSLIWRNRWVTTSTVVECRDALVYPGRPDRVVLLRRVEAQEREVRLRVELDVRAAFGQERMADLRCDADGCWTARVGSLWMRWSGAAEAVPGLDGALRAEITVGPGSQRDFVFELSRGPFGPPVQAAAAWEDTETTWTRATPELGHTFAPRDAQQAYALLRGLTRPDGGMVAAATMSLPERAEQGRNYDYRYAWIRDQCYAGIAVAEHGPDELLAETVSFMTARLLDDGDTLHPAYTVDGEPIPDEEQLSLPGYPGGQKVVKGNWVTRQFQLDVFGELLQLFAAAARRGCLDGQGWRAALIALDAIGAHWQRPEAGLWELGTDWWTHSRLSCVAGLRAMAEAAPTRRHNGAMVSLADRILAETSRRCLNSAGYWQRSPTEHGPDTACLLPSVRGAVTADDPRTRRTLDAVRNQLSVDGYVYRFSQAPRQLGEMEGAFLLCGFIMTMADWQQGNESAAMRWFERNRAACGPPGLFSEEYDVAQRQLRGNLPQAFVHALLLECTSIVVPR